MYLPRPFAFYNYNLDFNDKHNVKIMSGLVKVTSTILD